MRYLQTGIGIIGLAAVAAAAVNRHNEPESYVKPSSVNGLKAAIQAAKVQPSDFRNYRSWTTVAQTPQPMDPRLSPLCTQAVRIPLAAPNTPHEGFFVQCYVNSIGRDAMLNQANPNFPVGSIVIKEKLDSISPAAKVLLLTGMVKRAKGYNPLHGDWEYFNTSSDISKIASRGKLANCISCHDQKRSTDFVFRDQPYTAPNMPTFSGL